MRSRFLKRYRLGLVFGAFDPLHYGHIRLFRGAFDLCYKVVVCTESDSIIRTEKNREPYTSESDRMEDILSIVYVSDVVIRTPELDRAYWARQVDADCLVVGDDWRGRWRSGEALNLPIEYLPYTDGISSTLLRTL